MLPQSFDWAYTKAIKNSCYKKVGIFESKRWHFLMLKTFTDGTQVTVRPFGVVLLEYDQNLARLHLQHTNWLTQIPGNTRASCLTVALKNAASIPK